ncbi:glycosyltransferase family 4 protein, partial [Candidatus Parcubacteria bacterium]|nr:glycosyltransferase family 4 protein [Candidatus Parcubacteria bacterium]
MRVLLVNETLELRGGAERYVLSVAEGLRERGHEVYLSTEPKHLDEVDIIYINNIFDPALIGRLTALGKKTVRFFHDHATYCPGTPKYWFNSKQACSIKASPLCAYYAHKEKCLSRNPLVWWPKVWGVSEQRRANRKIGHYVVASEFMKAQLVLFGLDAAKITVNPLFSARTLLSKKRKEVTPPAILFVGRVFKEKGLEYLLQACAQLKAEYQLWVAGEGWDLERCRAVAKKLGIAPRIKFFGWVDDKILGDLYAQCRLVVVPSIWP